MTYIQFDRCQIEIIQEVFPNLMYNIREVSVWMIQPDSKRLEHVKNSYLYFVYIGSRLDLKIDLKKSPFYTHYYGKRTGYQLFCLENRKRLDPWSFRHQDNEVEKNPCIESWEVSNLFQTSWKLLEENEKQKYQSRVSEMDNKEFLVNYIKTFEEFIFRESINVKDEKTKSQMRIIFNNGKNEPIERLLYVIYEIENYTSESGLWEILGG